MTEWWPFLAVFWLLYLADALRFSRRAAFAFVTEGFSRRTLRLRHGSWRLANLLPGGWALGAADWPWSFSPEGVSNEPAGAVGRPAPEPDRVRVWRWEQLREVQARRGWIVAGAARVCPVTPTLDAAGLRALADTVAARSPADRAKVLGHWIEAHLRPAQVHRRLLVFRARTRLLGTVASLYGVLACLLTAYLIFGGASWWPAGWSERLARALPAVLGELALLHVVTLALAWWAHRRLFPDRGDDRFSLLLGAALLPPQTLRLRAQLAARLAVPVHPLALALAVTRAAERDGAVFAALGDVRWPLRPPETVPASLAITTWWRRALQPRFEALAQAQGVTLERLFAAPPSDGPESCRYCPRCCDQFVRPEPTCPRGVPLVDMPGRPR